jgi:hypothetical protein
MDTAAAHDWTRDHARRRRLEVEVRVKINENVENVSKLWIMMYAIAQTMLLADISSFYNFLHATSEL